jgi:hypothetical protein
MMEEVDEVDEVEEVDTPKRSRTLTWMLSVLVTFLAVDVVLMIVYITKEVGAR